MSLIQYAESGAEHFIPYAKKKLRELHDYMVASGVASFAKRIDVSDGTAIYLSSLLMGHGVFADRIRIVSAGGLFIASVGFYQGDEGQPFQYRPALFNRQGKISTRYPLLALGGTEAWIAFDGSVVLYRHTLGGGDISTLYLSRVSRAGKILTEYTVSAPEQFMTGLVSAVSADARFMYIVPLPVSDFRVYDAEEGTLDQTLIPLVAGEGWGTGNVILAAADRAPDSVVVAALSVIVPPETDPPAPYTDGVKYFKRDDGSAWAEHVIVAPVNSFGDDVPRRFGLAVTVSGDGLKVFTTTGFRVPVDPTYGVGSALSSVVYELYDDATLLASVQVTPPVPIAYGFGAPSTVSTIATNLTGSVTVFAQNSILDSDVVVQRHGHVTVVDERGQFTLEEHDADAQAYPKFLAVGVTDDGTKVVFLRQAADFGYTTVFYVRTTEGYEFAAEQAGAGNYMNPVTGAVFGNMADGSYITMRLTGTDGSYSVSSSALRDLATTFLANPVEPPADPPADKVAYTINLAGVFSAARGVI